ncbi:MAG TPA: GAF domain-containing sensor histidine kinase [Pseudonocardia sp.]|uniref:GAF domain-containing sensor histidine kinase n=1 Tax=Pseudonocardia sp. TaxID=60912 RepID=UPI002CA7E659|nr:GAF domain-containing sensor histidine kinase [Pseudonocardia sp.]HTF48114.1 GAF domain-containing sensor histidine kinase [Pseudonocardia sp.]
MPTVPREPAASRLRLPAPASRLSWRRRLAGALTGLVILPLLTMGLIQLGGVMNLPSQTLFYLLAVVVVALAGGLVPALAAAVAAAVLMDHYFIPPLNDFAIADSDNVVTLVAFVLAAAATSLVVGLGARRREAEALATANAESREELRVLADEQAALRRVATLVARGVTATEVFAAVAHEVGSVLGADTSTIVRLDPDGEVTVLTRIGDHPDSIPVGSRWTLELPLPLAVALRTARPARLDDQSQVPGAYADRLRRLGIRAGVAAPIVVEGRLWGGIGVGSRRGRFPAETDERMVGFTELVGTAIANAEGRAQLEESRGELGRLAEEQAALRRIATLVARGLPADEVFAAVTEEVGRLLHVSHATMTHYDPDGATRVVTAAWSSGHTAFPVGTRVGHGGRNVNTLVFQTGRPARIDDYDDADGPAAEAAREFGIRASVGVPISVEGRLWGVMFVGSGREEPMPADTEVRLAGFTELIATAIANAQARMELRGFAEEQAALRRVATLVARAARPEEVLAAVAEEAARLLQAHHASMSRYEPDGATRVAAAWGNTLPIGTRVGFGGRNVNTQVFETGRPVRIDNYDDASGAAAEGAHKLGIRASVGVPISVDGRLWGVMFVASTRQEPLPADTEARLAGFTELVATAIANAEAQAALTASRARIVAAADDARRRIERDLHDGTQQRLVSLSLALRVAQFTEPAVVPELRTQIGRVADELTAAIDELRELARGIHPPILSEGGLGPALRTLARRSAIPVELDIRTEIRPADCIEVAAYYVVSEALTNTTKHARASYAQVTVDERDALLRLSMVDDGVGGADPARGSGLIGLRDRVQALGGSIEVNSPPGAGTAILVELPLQLD